MQIKLEKVSVNQLHAADYNPRKDLKPGDQAYESLKQSIKTFGYVEPIIVNRHTGNIVGGHQRFKVIKDLGYTDVSVLYVDVPVEKEKALNIALNKIEGGWDDKK
ncbi:MAG: ParB N-terminal domain-containing protein, partial [Desulfobacteraceae bacterium]|nr:ParB N-terminal domain-containing protein [Desulfobacteraceae bacterium]